MRIRKVHANGIGQELSLKSGDKLVAFDDHPVTDILDYKFFDSQNDFVMTVDTGDELIDFEIAKDDVETLGLEFDNEEIDPPKVCCNKCIFCFVDQLPPNSRPALRVKEDDYRLSFLTGNYITLTNLAESDFERILRLKLSPLYISVHSTDDVTRRRMLGIENDERRNGKAVAPSEVEGPHGKRLRSASIMEQLRRLANGGIKLHTQIVYCPGVNEDYIKSARELLEVASTLAIVPVGLTKYANKGLKPVDKEIARKVIADVEGLPNVYLADEFYLKAELPLPPYEHYGNFEQIENGVGLIAQITNDNVQIISSVASHNDDITIATSVAAYDIIKKLAPNAEVIAIVNDYFGHSVTVAGLIVGQDLAKQLKGKVKGRLMIPRCMLKENTDLFLDGMTVGDLERELGVPIEVVSV